MNMQPAIPTATNQSLLGIVLLAHAAALFLLPAAQAAPVVWALLLTSVVWLTLVHWALIHEAIHKLLLPNQKANERAGRLLAIAMGTSLHVLRFGHLMHHQHNRHFHTECIAHPSLYARAQYYVHLLWGVYFSEVTTGLLMLFIPHRPFMRLARATFLRGHEDVAAAGERFFYQRGYIRQTRIDMAAALALYAAAFMLAKAQWMFVLGFIALRGLVISFMDNIYHYATPEDNSKAAKELALPPRISALILHGNYHETHHTNPSVPWRELPATHQAQQRRFDGSFLAHGVMQFHGPNLTTLSPA